MKTLASALKPWRSKLTDLTVSTGISSRRLVELADGSEATLRELRSIAPALGLSLKDFVSSTSANVDERVELMFRHSVVPTTRKTRSEVAVEPRANPFAKRIAHALTLLPPTTSDLGWLHAFDCQTITYLDAERNAETFRKLFFANDSISPLVRLPQIATDKLGILLFVLRGEKVEGASALVDGRAFILVSPRTHMPRMLFTLAHEIGHFVARSGTRGDFAMEDFEGSVGLNKNSNQLESYCNAFASCLLLPRAAVGVTLKMIRERMSINGSLGDIEILLLAHAYGVSFEVAARRCEDLELLPEGGARSLYDELKRQFGNPEKRAAQLGLPAPVEISFPMVSSQLLDAAAERVRRGDVSIGSAARILNLSIGDLMSLNRRTMASA